MVETMTSYALQRHLGWRTQSRLGQFLKRFRNFNTTLSLTPHQASSSSSSSSSPRNGLKAVEDETETMGKDKKMAGGQVRQVRRDTDSIEADFIVLFLSGFNM